MEKVLIVDDSLLGDDLVPGWVAEGVVIHLEFVNVKHTDGEGNMQSPPADCQGQGQHPH